MDEDIRQALLVIRSAISVLLDQEGQDRQMVAEMADAMLADLLAGQDKTIEFYVGRYCDVIGSPAEAAALALTIDLQITEWEEPPAPEPPDWEVVPGFSPLTYGEMRAEIAERKRRS